jgi:hypothetical protein
MAIFAEFGTIDGMVSVSHSSADDTCRFAFDRRRQHSRVPIACGPPANVS